jgi:predicted ATPase
MIFKVLSNQSRIPTNVARKAFLIEDNWDDWGKYRTVFTLVIFDNNGQRHDPGSVKIGQRGLLPDVKVAAGKRAPKLEREFESLGDQFFSLGQGDTYYETISQLPDDLSSAVFEGLRDCAFDLTIFEEARNETVMEESLLRDVQVTNLRNRYHRLANKNPILTEFHFEYRFPQAGVQDEPPTLAFDVMPESEPPTNVHVLIGRNGVGKTRCMKRLVQAISNEKEDAKKNGVISAQGLNKNTWSFAGLVVVSFSVFDSFDFPSATKSGLRAAWVGLPEIVDDNEEKPAGSMEKVKPLPERLADVFCRSLEKCRKGLRQERLRAAIETLENDPLFAEAEVNGFLNLSDGEWKSTVKRRFKNLSSGHAIVLLTITRLVELVDEQTIVLIDEPEGHLHPPLLSAFIRALSDLLVKRNGVALIATHSPVVLQEVPKSCVWVLRRSGNAAVAERPSIETFGENVGTLTREVFGLEVTTSGFHQLLKRVVSNPQNDYSAAIAHFDSQLGAEAQAIIRSLVAVRDKNRDQPQ